MWLAYLIIGLFDLALIWALIYILTPASRLLCHKFKGLRQALWQRPQGLATGFPVEDDYPPRPADH